MDLILVDENDNPTGTMEKMEAHKRGLLHRAFSIFIFNAKGDMLLHQRATDKYHSGGLWTNACCSHPRSDQQTMKAAEIRLKEEMGFTVPLKKIFDFTYKAALDNGLIEHEYDHVFLGIYDGDIDPDKDEVSNFCFLSMTEIRSSIQSQPQKYSEWFKIAFPRMEEYLATMQSA